MTHEELLAKLDDENFNKVWANHQLVQDMRYALRAVVELHKPKEAPEFNKWLCTCGVRAMTIYPCPTIKAITSKLL